MGSENDNINWIITPVFNCICYLGEEITQNALLQRSLISLSNMEYVLNFAKQSFIEKNIPVGAIDRLIGEHVFLKEKSKEIISSDYDSINSHSLVNLWAIIEVTVEDTVVLVLEKGNIALEDISDRGMKVKSGLNLSSDVDRRKIYRSIEAQSRNNSNVGESIINIMKIFDISLDLNDKTNRLLSEINSVRNCILHRGGVLDEKAGKDVFVGKHKVGEKINISKSVYLAYYGAIKELATNLMGAVTESPYITRNGE